MILHIRSIIGQLQSSFKSANSQRAIIYYHHKSYNYVTDIIIGERERIVFTANVLHLATNMFRFCSNMFRLCSVFSNTLRNEY